MRELDMPRTPRRWSEVDEQTRVSTIYGGSEAFLAEVIRITADALPAPKVKVKKAPATRRVRK